MEESSKLIIPLRRGQKVDLSNSELVLDKARGKQIRLDLEFERTGTKFMAVNTMLWKIRLRGKKDDFILS